jgi:diacylglycerol kinase family enzyme
LKKLLGGAAYFVTGLTKLGTFRPDAARFQGPDFEWNGSLTILAIGNARQAGGGNVLRRS